MIGICVRVVVAAQFLLIHLKMPVIQYLLFNTESIDHIVQHCSVCYSNTNNCFI